MSISFSMVFDRCTITHIVIFKSCLREFVGSLLWAWYDASLLCLCILYFTRSVYVLFDT